MVRSGQSGVIRGVVFDKDGTLFDFRRSWSAWTRDRLLELAGGAQDRARPLGKLIGYDIDLEAFHPESIVIAGSVAEVAQVLVQGLPGAEAVTLERWLARAAADVPMVPAVPLAPLLDGLRRHGLGLGVATNDAEAAARVQLEDAGIVDKFHIIAGYDSGHGAKPGPGMCHAVAAALGCAPGACVMVGDSAHDLVAGRAAGMATVGVLTGIATASDLAPLADAVLPDIGALPGWLGLGP